MSQPYSRHRLAILTAVGAYPTIVGLLLILNPLLGDASVFIKAGILVPLMVTLLTYVVMPLMTETFAGWLIPTARPSGTTRRGVVAAITVFTLLPLVTASAHADETTSSNDEQTIRTKLDRWKELWSQTGAGKLFTLDGYEDLFVRNDAVDKMLTFDSYVPKWASTQINGFDDYKTIWEKDVNESFPNWTITRMDIIRINIAQSGDMAWSAINFWGEGNRDGERYEGSQHGTHVWQKTGGDWKIIHEHLTAPITVHGVPNAKIDAPSDTTPAPNQTPVANKADPLAGMSVDHVMINVSDFERSVRWYTDKLGFKETVRWTVDGLDGTDLAYLKRGDFMIELASGLKTDATAQLPRATDFASHFAQRGITHLCFKVKDVDAALSALNQNDVPTFSPAIDFPALDVRVGFIQDPDGNVIEFKGPMAGNNVVNGKAVFAN